MCTLAIQHGLLSFIRLLTTAVAAGWVSSPMSWSPDARWLSYTVAPDPGPIERTPGWIFDVSHARPGNRDGRGDGPANATAGAGTYRIWASQRDGEASVPMEESAWPLTAPSWSPQGRSMVYARFVPESIDPHQPVPSGRFDVVIQDRLDRKRTLVSVPEFELDRGASDQFPHVAAAWSPDGQWLAFPRPGRIPAILIIKVDSHKVLRTLDRAMLPAWSPDAMKLAFIRVDESNENTLQVLERHGQTFIRARTILPVGRVAAPMAWADDGRSILALIEKSGLQFPDLDLARVSLETGGASRIFSAAPEVVRRGAMIRGVAIDFRREEDLCFFSVDLEGRDADVCWSVPQEQLSFKRFHPLDQTLRIGSLAIAPDGHSVAMRFGTPGGLSLPAVFDLATEQTTLIVPDEAARRTWLSLLVRTSRTLLGAALSLAIAEGKPADRPTLLPLPDEIPPGHPLHARLAKLGRYGSTLCTTRRGREAAEAEGETATDREDRLFFDYLRGDFAAAGSDLDALEPWITARRNRLALLSLRAQVLWGQGDSSGAREVAEYLVQAVGGPVHRVEETPLGRSLVPEPGWGRPWARYLATRVGQPLASAEMQAGPTPGDRDDPMQGNLFAPPDLPRMPFPRDRDRAGHVPFAPHPPGDELEAIRARFLRFEPGGVPQPPPLPRPIEVRRGQPGGPR